MPRGWHDAHLPYAVPFPLVLDRVRGTLLPPHCHPLSSLSSPLAPFMALCLSPSYSSLGQWILGAHLSPRRAAMYAAPPAACPPPATGHAGAIPAGAIPRLHLKTCACHLSPLMPLPQAHLPHTGLHLAPYRRGRATPWDLAPGVATTLPGITLPAAPGACRLP